MTITYGFVFLNLLPSFFCVILHVEFVILEKLKNEHKEVNSNNKETIA